MKRYTFVAIALVLGISTAQAKERSKTHDSATSSYSAPSHSSGETHLGVGYSSIPSRGSPAGHATFWIDFNDTHSLQALLGFGGTSPTFLFSSGAIYRATLAGNQSTGFHVGGGFVMGTYGAFFVNIAPIAGFHVSWPGTDHLRMSVDGGPIFAIDDGNFNFGLSPASTLLGLSVQYMF